MKISSSSRSLRIFSPGFGSGLRPENPPPSRTGRPSACSSIEQNHPKHLPSGFRKLRCHQHPGRCPPTRAVRGGRRDLETVIFFTFYYIYLYHVGNQFWGFAMSTLAKLFMSGRSQAIRWPASLRIAASEVLIERVGGAYLIKPRTEASQNLGEWMRGFYDSTEPLPEEFLAERSDEPPQVRDWP